MSVFIEKARCCGAFDDDRHNNGAIAQNDVTQHRATPYYNRRKHLREQQKARDYWVSMYGPEAEMLSRGGVSWVGMM